MKEKIYGPGEIIYNQTDKDNRVYFVVRGRLQKRQENSASSNQQHLLQQISVIQIRGALVRENTHAGLDEYSCCID